MISPEEAAQPIAVARRYAALSGAFDPEGLLEALGPVSNDVAVTVTANLADACDTGIEGGRWLMRASARQRELGDWGTPEELQEAVEWRRSLETDPATDDLLAALVGEGSYQPDAVLETTKGAPDRPSLVRLAVALDRAGENAPAHGALDAVRSALGRADAEMRYEAVLGAGFFGREAELSQLASWIARASVELPVRALFVTGLPGIGKSTLLEMASQRSSTTGDRPAIVVRFDFDRSGLEVQDLVGLTLELSRQVAIAVGEDAASLSQARLTAAGATQTTGPAVKGETLERVPEELSSVLGDVVQRSGRPLLVVLDTLEVLRGRGETHPRRLFAFLDQLVARGANPMAVIAAGRGDALDSAPDRLAETISLTGLEPAAADAMLAALDVPPDAFGPIRDLAEGNPLVLRLAAQTAREAGVAALDEVQGKQEVAAAFLYRFLLSRIGVKKLRVLAEPGLLVRRINPDVIAEVLVPAMRLEALAPGEAATLFEALAAHHWLVEPDSVPGWVRHRSDIRRTLLRLLYQGTGKAEAARVDRAAASWFARRDEPFAPVEAVYHRLQAMRTSPRPPAIDPSVLAQLDDETLAELPIRAQDLVRSLRGERTSKFRAEAGEAAPAFDLADAATELEALLERGDLLEAAYVHERSFSVAELQPGSREADVDLAFLWRSGRWTAAARLARAHTFPRAHGGMEWWRGRSPLTALAQLELWAELRFTEAVRSFRRDPELAGYAVELSAGSAKGSLANGALGFALLAAGAQRSRSTWNVENPMDGAAAVWSNPATWVNDRLGTGDQRAVDALSLPATRFEAFVADPPTEPGGQRRPRFPNPHTRSSAARLLATSTPYGPVAESLRRDGGDRVLSHLSRVDFELAERDGLPPTGAGGWSVGPAVSPEGSVDNLAALGLLAEWIGAAAFVLRHADLRQIALRAERWRRTTAGDWSYPTRPAGVAPTAWANRPDATIADRLDQLSSAPDPAAASREQLALWWGPDGDADPVARIEGRAKAAFAEARDTARGSPPTAAARASAAAVALLGRDVPAAFVPPLAVLISSE
jgi:hypothetical protein